METAEAAGQDAAGEEGAEFAFDEGREGLVLGVASRRGGEVACWLAAPSMVGQHSDSVRLLSRLRGELQLRR